MEEEEMSQTTQNAMSILMAAGEARNECKQAYEAMAKFDFALAQEKISAADQKILAAHKIQTDAIQGTFRGEELEYSLLFAHAQDTLMTIYSEIIVCKQLAEVFGSLDARLSKLEGGN